MLSEQSFPRLTGIPQSVTYTTPCFGVIALLKCFPLAGDNASGAVLSFPCCSTEKVVTRFLCFLNGSRRGSMSAGDLQIDFEGNASFDRIF